MTERVTHYKCAACGVEGEAPFPIDPNRPFYCKECYRKRGKPEGAA